MSEEVTVDCQNLLQSLKDTVEGLLISQLSNVWNVYGGLNRLHNAIEKIFAHGCRNFNHDGDPDYWSFIQGLSWLQPSLAISPSLTSNDIADSVSPVLKGKASAWIYTSLEAHTLSQKLSWLLSDRSHITSCYKKSAFLSQEKYGEATLICLKAVEQNQSSILADIDPSLYLTKWNVKAFRKTHRRCSSLPETQYAPWHTKRLKTLRTKVSEDSARWETDEASANKYSNMLSEVDIVQTNEMESHKDLINERFGFISSKLWKSSPSLSLTTFEYSENLNRSTSWSHEINSNSFRTCLTKQKMQKSAAVNRPTKSGLSEPQSMLSPSILKIDYKGLQSDNKSAVEHGSSSQKLNRSWKPRVVNSLKPSTSRKLNLDQHHASSVRRNDILDKIDVVQPNIGLPFMNSGSSDTLNVGSKSSDESSTSLKQSVRPTELNLTAKTWDLRSTDVSCLEPWVTQSASKLPINEPNPRRPRITGSAPELDSSLKTYKKSFIEDGGSSVLPMSVGFFPKPVEGQSLTSFLSSGQFARPSAELDRENAHFSISEAMIAAIEQVKCNRQLRLVEETGGVGDESDEEIKHLKQRIRLRRRQCQREKQRHIWGTSLLSDGKTDTTTDTSPHTPTSSSPGTTSDSISTDDVDDMEVDEVKNLSQLKHSGLSMSMASLYSEADLSKQSSFRTGTDALTDSIVSAEGVALSLLRQFKEKQLPRASDLQWLVSEQDAPQELLPLPKSWPVSPDEAEDSDMRQATPLRGTVEWAPPRPQVIFTLHPAPVRRILMVKQNSRCAGCGMKVAPEYAHKFRYCEYLGRYFCTGCHTNQLALIPGRVLVKWDFTRCPVSSFSYRLLDQMMSDPLFRIGDLNPSLYRKARQLERTRQLRIQLNYLKDFVLTCRFAEELQERLQKEPAYLIAEQDTYSMQDLVQVKSGELATRFRELVICASQHVADCHLCQARGFVCELCSVREVIYPWQLSKVTRCAQCGACFHLNCWRPGSCPRCIRLKTRKLNRDL